MQYIVCLLYTSELTLKDVPLVAYDEEGKRVDVEIVPSTVDAKLTITSPSKETVSYTHLDVYKRQGLS